MTLKHANKNKPGSLTRRSALKLGAGTALLSTLPPWLSGCVGVSEAKNTHSSMIKANLTKHKIPGASIAYIDNAEVKWHRGFGVTNIDTQEPVTKKTLFQGASMTKPLFAYVVMQAVDRGELSLDDKLTDYVIPEDLSDNPWNYEITVHDVLRHTTGLPNWRADKGGPESLEASYKPGTDTSYSGEAFHWLQKVLEKVTNRGLDKFMRERLLIPAGLSDMALLWTPVRDSREVYSHRLNDDNELYVDQLQYIREHGGRLNEVAIRWEKPMNSWTTKDHFKAVQEMRKHTHPRLTKYEQWFWNRPGMSTIDSASSLRCTAGDYAKFVCLMMPRNRRQDWEIREKTRQSMLTSHFETDIENGVLPRGLGWGLEKRPNGMAYYHWGSNGYSHKCMAFADLSTRKGVVVMTNGPSGNDFIKDVATELLEQDYVGILS